MLFLGHKKIVCSSLLCGLLLFFIVAPAFADGDKKDNVRRFLKENGQAVQSVLRGGDLFLSSFGDGMLMSSDSAVKSAGRVVRALGSVCHGSANVYNEELPSNLLAIRCAVDIAGAGILIAKDTTPTQEQKLGSKLASLGFGIFARLFSAGADFMAINDVLSKVNEKKEGQEETGIWRSLRRWGKKGLSVAGKVSHALADLVSNAPATTKLCSTISAGIGVYGTLYPQSEQQAAAGGVVTRDRSEKLAWFTNELGPDDDIRPGLRAFEGDEGACPICLSEDGLDGKTSCKRKHMLICSQCNKTMHRSCGGQWINKKKTCPNCRKKFKKCTNGVLTG